MSQSVETTDPFPVRRCVGITLAGKPCGFTPVKGEDTCVNHSPRAADYRALARQNKAEFHRREKEERTLVHRERLARETEAFSPALIAKLTEHALCSERAASLRALEMLFAYHMGRPRVQLDLQATQVPLPLVTREEAEEIARKLLGGN